MVSVNERTEFENPGTNSMRRCNSSSCVIHFSLFGRIQLWLRAVRSPEDFDLNANFKRSKCFRQRQTECLHSVVRMCRILCSVLRSPKTSKSPQRPDPKPKGRGKGGKGKKGTSSLDEWPDGQENPPSDEEAIEEVAGLFVGAVGRHERYSQRDWQAWEQIQKQARQQSESYKTGCQCSRR